MIFSPDPKSESRLPLLDLNIYVPRDERFGHLKMSDFLGFALKAIIEAVLPTIRTFVDTTPKEFDSFEDIMKLYEGGLKVPDDDPALAEIKKKIPFELIRTLLPDGGDHLLKLPLPHVIRSGKSAVRITSYGHNLLANVSVFLIDSHILNFMMFQRIRWLGRLMRSLHEKCWQA